MRKNSRATRAARYHLVQCFEVVCLTTTEFEVPRQRDRFLDRIPLE